MPPLSPERCEQRARNAALARHHSDYRRELKAAAAERYVKALATDPPLTAEQKTRLAVLLLAPGGEAP